MTQLLKKIVPIITVLVVSSCAAGNKINYKNPKKVTLAFYKALGNYDYERAKKMGTENAQKTLSILQNLHDLLPEEERVAVKAEAEIILKHLKKVTCETQEDIAVCKICCTEEGAFLTEDLWLKKVDKKWLVEINKETSTD